MARAICSRKCALLGCIVLVCQLVFVAFVVRTLRAGTGSAGGSSGGSGGPVLPVYQAPPALRRPPVLPADIATAAAVAGGLPAVAVAPALSAAGTADPDTSNGASEAASTYLSQKLRAVSWQLKRSVLDVAQLLGKTGAANANMGAESPIRSISHSAKCSASPKVPTFSAATYNLWNLNAPWATRRQRMAASLAALSPALDVVGVQEIRVASTSDGLRAGTVASAALAYGGTPDVTSSQPNQLDELCAELNALLPSDTPSSVRYTAVSRVVATEQNGHTESIGLLTRHPIVRVTTKQLQSAGTPTRLVLHVQLNVDHIGPLNVFVVHTSYVDTEQCHQLVRLHEYMHSECDPTVPQVVVGDFNSYVDWEWSVDWLTGAMPRALWFSDTQGCGAAFRAYQSRTVMTSRLMPPSRGGGGYGSYAYRDAWEHVYGRESRTVRPPSSTAPGAPTTSSVFGATFPTFRDGNRFADESRPDRILTGGNAGSQGLTPCDASVFGSEPFPYAPAGAATPQLMYASDHCGVFATFTWDDTVVRQTLGHAAQAAAAAMSHHSDANDGGAETAAGGAGAEAGAEADPFPHHPMVVPAALYSSLPTHKSYHIEYSFDRDSATHFWSSSSPEVGDFVVVLFDRLQERIHTVRLQTGQPLQPAQDTLHHVRVDVADSVVEGAAKGEVVNDSPLWPHRIRSATSSKPVSRSVATQLSGMRFKTIGYCTTPAPVPGALGAPPTPGVGECVVKCTSDEPHGCALKAVRFVCTAAHQSWLSVREISFT